MRFKTGNNTVGSTPDQYLGIDQAKAHKIASLLIQKYKSRVTPVREITVNALESTLKAAENGAELRPVEINVTLNNDSSPSPFRNENDYSDTKNDGVITVQDYGEGMSPDFMVNKFPNLGNSTKEDDDQAIGGMGIGSKSILSMTDYATWRTVKDGVATVLAMSQDNVGITINHNTFPAPNEPNGTLVTIPVSGSVLSYVMDNINQEFLDYFSADYIKFTYNGFERPVGRVVDSVVHTATNGTQFLPVSEDTFGYRGAKVHLMVNGAPYPVPGDFDKYILTKRESPWKQLSNVASVSGYGSHDIHTGEIVVNLDHNHPEVIILPSREGLIESRELNNLIGNAIDEAVYEIVKDNQDKVNSSRDVKEWFDNLTEFIDNGLFEITYLGRNSLNSLIRNLIGHQDNIVGYRNCNVIFDIKRNEYIPLGEAVGTTGKVFHGTCSVDTKNFSSLEREPAWKCILNEMVSLTNGNAMGENLINASGISDIITDEKIAFLMPEDVEKNNIESLELISKFNFVPEGFNVDKVYDHLGLEFSDIHPDTVRENMLKLVRSASRKGTRIKASKIERPIIVHRYAEGQGFVEVNAPATVPALTRWIDSDLKGFTGKVLCIPECENETNPDADLFFNATAQEASDMLESAGIDDLLIVRSVKDTLSDNYHVRVAKAVDNTGLNILDSEEIPRRNIVRKYYKYNSCIDDKVRNNLESILNYLSREEVNYRLEIKNKVKGLGLSVNETIDKINNLKELASITDHNGENVLGILSDNFEMTTLYHTLIEHVDVDPECLVYKYSSSSLLYDIRVAVSRNKDMFVDAEEVMEILYNIRSIDSFLMLEGNRLSDVITLFTNMSEQLRKKNVDIQSVA